MIEIVKAVGKAIGYIGMGLGILSIDAAGQNRWALPVALVSMAIILFCLYHDGVVAERQAYEERRLRG